MQQKDTRALLRESGYSDRAVEYYVKRAYVGRIDGPDARYAYTGPCGDTMEFTLRIGDGVIHDARFQAVGCAGSFAAGSGLSEVIRGMSVREAEEVGEEDILAHLGGVPVQKKHCVCLALRTLRYALASYREETVAKKRHRVTVNA